MAWTEAFQRAYPQATEVVLTFNPGGANAAGSLRFKEDLIALSRRLGLLLRIAHYPPYISKWLPIEHRLFSQVGHALRGVILHSPQTALRAIQRVPTRTGLSVVARILDRLHDISRKCSDKFPDIKDQFIRYDCVLGEWNDLVDGHGLNPKCV